MKKLLIMLLMAALCLTGMAVAEDAVERVITGELEDGGYVIRIPLKEDEAGWEADDMAQDPSIVRLESAEVVDGSFVVRYAPVADGDVSVGVRHFDGIACDEALTWDLSVADGAITEVTGGSHTKAPEDAEMDPMLSGIWRRQENDQEYLFVERNAEKGWDVQYIAPGEAGATEFEATIFYDCELDEFVYDNGAFRKMPITDDDGNVEAEPIVEGTSGTFTLKAEDALAFSWYNSLSPEETVDFIRADAVDTSDWMDFTFDGTGVAMKMPFELIYDDSEPVEGTVFSSVNDVLALQVTIEEQDFTDRQALADYYGALDYVVKAEPVEINGVEMVYIEGADDDVTAYGVISPEGTTYRFTFYPLDEDGKGAALARTMAQTFCDCGSVEQNIRTIAPMNEIIDTQDGTYPAAFDRADLTVDGLKNVKLFTEDCYDIVDISMLQVGDIIFIGDEPVRVASLEKGDFLKINGGLDEGGYDLVAVDEDNCWKVSGYDDYASYTAQGSYDFDLDENVSLNDAWDIEGEPVTATGAAEVVKAVAESENDSFDQYNTTVRIEGGRVVEINRRYVP